MKLRNLVLCFSILLSSLFFPLQAQASVATAQTANENSAFQAMDDYYFVITPLTGALACGLAAGLPGLALGLAAGGVDEALIHFGYTSQRHLTLGILTASTFATLGLPYHIAEIVAFGLSTSISSGAITIESTKLAHPANAMISGVALANAYTCPGYMGLGAGLAAYAIDHYTNTTAYSEALTNIAAVSVFAPIFGRLLTSPMPKVLAPVASFIQDNSVRIGIAIVAIYKGSPKKSASDTDNHIQNTVSPEEFHKELSAVFKRLTNSTIVDDLFRQQLVYRLGAASLTVQTGFMWSSYIQKSMEKMAALSPGNHASQTAYNNVLVAIAFLLVADLSFETVTRSVIAPYQTEKLNRILTAAMRERIMKKEAPLLLRSNTTIEADVNKFEENIATLSSTGINLIWSTADSYTTALQSSILLFNNNALDVLIFLQSYTSSISALQTMIQDKMEKIEDKIKVAEDQIKSLESDIKKKAKIVLGGGKQDLLHQKILDLEARIRTYNSEKFKWDIALQIIRTSRRYSDYLATNMLISQKITDAQLNKTQMFTSRDAARDVISSGSWYLNNQADIKRTNIAAKSLLSVMDFLDKPCDETSTLKITHSQSNENSIYFSDFKVGVLNPFRELLVADQFELKAGRYVVTGASGSGKSSFLSKVRGIKCNGIYAHGNIEFRATEISNDPVYELTQEDYIAPNSSLLENLTGKTSKQLEDDLEIRQRATRYLTELKIDDLGLSGLASNLDEEKNWGDTLSGGQKRKIAIVAMLLKKPKFVIMDETFAGMDEQAIKIAQRLISNELAESVILIVDHQAEANNFDTFYQQNLHLENHSLVLRPMNVD